MLHTRRPKKQETELDITSFMNLMIVLVPVLLMTMVFSHVTVLDLTLPNLGGDTVLPEDAKNQILEVVIKDDELVVNYPAGIQLKTIPKKDGVHNFDFLSLVLQEVKRRLQKEGIEKRDILILSQPDTRYQTLVTTMDTVRSFKAVVAASVVNAELFPEISLGDAPAPKADQNTEGK